MTIGIHSQRISILYLIVGHSFVKFEPFRDILILQYLFFRFQLYRTYHTENREIVICVEIWFEQSRQLWIVFVEGAGYTLLHIKKKTPSTN